MAEIVKSVDYGRMKSKKAPAMTSSQSGDKSKEAMERMRSDPKLSGTIALGAAVLGFVVWVGDKGEVNDTCTSVNTALVQVGAVGEQNTALEWKNNIRSFIDTVTFGTVINDQRTLSGVAADLSQNRGYYIPTERLVAANRDAEFIQFDENGNLQQRMPVQASEAGTFCVNVPAPIYGGYELIQRDGVTIAQLAEQSFVDTATIHNLNPSLADMVDEESLPIGTAIRMTEALDATVVLREMTADEANINQLTAGDAAQRQKLIIANAALIGAGQAINDGQRAFLPYSPTEFLEEKALATEAIVAAFDPASIALDTSFIEDAPLLAAAAKEASEATIEIVQIALAPIEGLIPTSESNGTIAINAERYGETVWSKEELVNIQANLPFYLEAERQTGVSWQFLAVIHERESNQLRGGPDNGQGPYQIYGERGTHTVGPITDEEFMNETIHVAQLIANDYVHRVGFDTPPTADNIDANMRVFFAFNGMAAEYKAQAAALGFDPETQGEQGSPYVMNLVDDQRNSTINPNWKQFRADGGDFREADQRPGTYVLYRDLLNITEFIPNVPSKAALVEKYGNVSGQLADNELEVIGEQWGGQRLNGRAAAAFRALNDDYANSHGGVSIGITDSYRTLDGQRNVYAQKPNLAAEPGESNHGWGFAIDIVLDGLDYNWLRVYGPTYGWDNPEWARDGKGREEPWHWEYEPN